MGFKDETEIKTAEDIVKEQLDTEILLEEIEQPEIPENTEDIKDNSVDTEEIVEETSDSTETEEFESEETAEDSPKKKKKFFLQTPIIIAACIVLGTLLGYFLFVGFFLHDPAGLWSVSDDEGTTYYYEFKDDGSCVMTIGTIDNIGAYYKSQTETGDSIYINQYYGMFAGEYNYTITGSRLLGNQKMILETNGYEYELTQVGSKENLLEKPVDFIPNEELLGEWEYLIPEYGVSYTFTFNKDGTMLYNQADTVIYTATYTVDDENVHMTFFTNEEQTVDLPYHFDGDTLNLMELECHRVGAESTADEA
ncbi:MAG: hypothetical protein IJH32_09320 [Ruminococcus sp.]|nr:hypothetical protein [Ruminococcus sp.]